MHNKFSQSVSAINNARAPSPGTFRPKSRPSLPRPESPVRHMQPNAGHTPAAGSRQSINMLSQSARLPAASASRYTASPTPSKMGSVRGGPALRSKPPFTNNDMRTTSTTSTASYSTDHSSISDNHSTTEITQLQSIIAEKNAKIAALTTKFNSHKSDFRNTLDTLEFASTETECVYEKKVEDLLEEQRILLAQGEDVESVAQQLRQLEEVVQELEEGLEDARRGEAEARGEVEFLRGEVERVRAELRRERERNVELVREIEDHRRDKATGRIRAGSKALNGTNGDGAYNSPRRTSQEGTWSPSKSRSKALMSPEPKSTSQERPLSSPEPSVQKEAQFHEENIATPTPGPSSKRTSRTFPTAAAVAMNHRPQDSAIDDKDGAKEATESPVLPNNASATSVSTPPGPKKAPSFDPDKWCAFCESDGHDSISCPLDNDI